MCYSAQIEQDYRAYVRRWGAEVDLAEFERLYWRRSEGGRIRTPKAMDAAFATPASAEEYRIREAIAVFSEREALRLEQELFAQRKRLADAERSLTLKHTKSAAESRRIATAKIATLRAQLADLARREPEPRDARIFPGWYAPVLVREHGHLVVKPMRYGCRPAGVPTDWDRRYPGTFNARRDKLATSWKRLFGRRHGLAIVSAFYENVPRHRCEGRVLGAGEVEESVVLEFRPEDGSEMLVACLWSPWQGAGEPDLLSFAAITDEPPPEVAAAGHDRCLIPLKPVNVAAWLDPDPFDTAATQALLEDRERPYYAHRLAA